MKRTYAVVAIALTALAVALSGADAQAPIHFVLQKIDFTLEVCETPERHAPETMPGGVAVFDANGDGAPDIFFTNGADIRTLKKSDAKYANRLFLNDGHGRFTDATARAGLAGTGYDMGAAVADYDNDGKPDLFVAGVYRNTLYHNNGDGTFTDVTEKSGLAAKPAYEVPKLWAVTGAWVDLNNDGLLDLVVVNYLAWTAESDPVCNYNGAREYCHPKYYKRTPNQVFQNLGNGRFRDVTAESGMLEHAGKGMGIGVFDYDLDGRMDLFVANDKIYNSLFRNVGEGAKIRFEERAFEAGVALRDDGTSISNMGIDCGDLDNDGYPDIIDVALDDETFPLFHNTGHGDFTDATQESRMAALSLPMAGYSPVIADFDNDGWKDIFVSRGHVQSLAAAPRITVEQNNSVFRNLTKLRFAALTNEAGFNATAPARHRGSAVADFNGDGRMDVVVSAIGKPAEIWMNDAGGAGHWIAFALEGTKSNRDGIGARIRVVTKSLTQHRQYVSAAGYSSSALVPAHFGLGGDDKVERVEIRWPSGTTQTLTNVGIDRVVRVREPQ